MSDTNTTEPVLPGQVAELGPRDTLCLLFRGRLSEEQRRRIRDAYAAGGLRVVVAEADDFMILRG